MLESCTGRLTWTRCSAGVRQWRTQPRGITTGVHLRDGKEPTLFGFGSVLSKMRVLVRFVRFGFGSIPISSPSVSMVGAHRQYGNGSPQRGSAAEPWYGVKSPRR